MMENGLFPVDGWNISASALKVQTVPHSKGEAPSKSSKKRKRGLSTALSSGVTDQNVSELYENYVRAEASSRGARLVEKVSPEAANDTKLQRKKVSQKGRGGQHKESGEEQAGDRSRINSKASSDFEVVSLGTVTAEPKPPKKKKKKESVVGTAEANDLQVGQDVRNDQDVSRALGEIEKSIHEALPLYKKSSNEEERSSTGKQESTSEQNRVELEKGTVALESLPEKVEMQENSAPSNEHRKKTIDKKHAKRLAKQLKKNVAAGTSSTADDHINVHISNGEQMDNGASTTSASTSKDPETIAFTEPKRLLNKAEAAGRIKHLELQHREALEKLDQEILEQQKAAQARRRDLSNEFKAEKAKILHDVDPHDGEISRSDSTSDGHGQSELKTSREMSTGLKLTGKAADPAENRNPEAPVANRRNHNALSSIVKEEASRNTAESTSAPLFGSLPGVKTPVQQKMHDKLISSRFRIYNEQLYTTPSSAAAKIFRDDPNGFETYHAGFRNQVQLWPVNPLDVLIRELRIRAPKLPGRNQKGARLQKAEDGSLAAPLLRHPHNGSCRIADLGCGDARLASSLADVISNKRFKLFISSFDLERPKGPNALLVTKADITNLAAVGIQHPSFEIVICCLSLMSTNWVQIVDECARILVLGGEVWVAEVKSRFRRKDENSNAKKVDNKTLKGKKQVNEENQEPDWRDGLEEPSSNDNTDVTAFVDVFRRRGLELKGEVDKSNKMFVSMKFVKTGKPTLDGTKAVGLYAQKGAEGRKRKFERVTTSDSVDMGKIVEEGKVLKPCVYKTR